MLLLPAVSTTTAATAPLSPLVKSIPPSLRWARCRSLIRNERCKRKSFFSCLTFVVWDVRKIYYQRENNLIRFQTSRSTFIQDVGVLPRTRHSRNLSREVIYILLRLPNGNKSDMSVHSSSPFFTRPLLSLLFLSSIHQ